MKVIVWLIKDNAKGHFKVSNIMKEYYQKPKILKILYLPNSLDLNMIKKIWDYQKDKIKEYLVYSGLEKDIICTKKFII